MFSLGHLKEVLFFMMVIFIFLDFFCIFFLVGILTCALLICEIVHF